MKRRLTAHIHRSKKASPPPPKKMPYWSKKGVTFTSQPLPFGARKSNFNFTSLPSPPGVITGNKFEMVGVENSPGNVNVDQSVETIRHRRKIMPTLGFFKAG